MKKYKSLLTQVLVIGCMVGIMGCGKETDTDLAKDYQINNMSAKVSDENIEFLQDALKAYRDIKIKAGNSESARQIYLVTDEEYAGELGYSFKEMDEQAFVITKEEDGIYLLAPTDDGVRRAGTYFARNFVSENGEVLLKIDERYVENGKAVKEALYIGDNSIEEYELAYSDEDAKAVCKELQYYIQQTTGDFLDIVSETQSDEKVINLSVSEGTESYAEIYDGTVSIVAGSKEELLNEVHVFINTYLGWMYSENADARISSVNSVIRIPSEVYYVEPWIEEREAIVTLWNINYSRGAYLDSDVSLKNNLIDYSEEQLYEYVKMLKYCGFTGIQVTEMCSTWAGVGSYEACHEKLRMMADAAHSLDMKFTLWVWGAEFADCGWIDRSEIYGGGNNRFSYENPDALAFFDKYYDIYAELADCCDRVIGHYYDPGNLHTAEEIAFYAKMLKDKVQAVNPDIDFGISCWVDIYDKNIFIDTLGNDITLYECGHHDVEADYEDFREEISGFDCRMGTWAWNTCEMEIDQLAQMNFNLEIIRSVYQTARKYDDIAKPTYWSEMDSYHVLNAFSLYCAGHLLIDPDTESEVIYDQIATAVVGPEYSYDFAEMLSIIQDARSGYTWDTYFWSNDNYILKSDAYKAEEIKERCDRVLPILDQMIDEGIESYTMPFPIPLQDVLQLIKPHLVQIRDYAEFRINLAQLEKDYADGMEKTAAESRLYEISVPIRNYNCIIGAWGQIEARAQYEMVLDFCERTGCKVPMYSAFQEERKQHIVAQVSVYQKEYANPYVVYAPYYQWGLAYGEEETARLVEELVQEGIFIRCEDGGVYLSDWENYLFNFDS